MQYVIRHRIAGRIRMTIPSLRYATGAISELARDVGKIGGVTHVRANPACTSLAIGYDPDDICVELTVLDYVEQWQYAPREHNIRVAASPTPSLPASTFGLLLSVSRLQIAPLTGLITLFAASGSFRRAWQVLRSEKRLNVDLLDSMAISLSLLRGRAFTAALVTWLVNLGDTIHAHTAASVRQEILPLLEFQSQSCLLWRGGKLIPVRADTLVIGDEIQVDMGNTIAVDGIVVEGKAEVSQTSLTGEPLPVLRQVGDDVYAGSVLCEGSLRVRVSAAEKETALGRISAMIDAMPLGDTRAQNYAERFGDRLVAPILGGAGVLYALNPDLDRLTSMTIVDYGTGMRVAGPTAILAAVARAARHGLLFKSGSILERLAEVDVMVFDKTGTVTCGRPVVQEICSYASSWSEEQLLIVAAAAGQGLHHPVTRALYERVAPLADVLPTRSKVTMHVGLGVAATIDDDEVLIGNARFMQEQDVTTDAAKSDINRLGKEAQSYMLIAINGVLTGLISYADEIRPEMLGILTALRARGIHKILLLTGDHKQVAKHVAQNLGFTDYIAGILPDGKAQHIESLQRAGHVVAMIGDGINDTVALCAADVGIAVHGGAEASRQIAGLTMMHDDLLGLITALDISRETMALMRQNFKLIAWLNTIALVLAIPSGRVPPGMIAALSNGSTILASLNALRPAFLPSTRD